MLTKFNRWNQDVYFKILNVFMTEKPSRSYGLADIRLMFFMGAFFSSVIFLFLITLVRMRSLPPSVYNINTQELHE